MAEAKLPTVHIPMAVDTRGIDSGLSAAERKLRASAKKMAAIEERQASSGRMALTKKVGAMTFQRAGFGSVGELAGMALAGGGIGLAAAGLTAGFMAFDVAQQKLREAITGASEALKQFEETGKQTFAANATVLRGLAFMEERQKAAGPGVLGGIAQGFQFGRSTQLEQGGGGFWGDLYTRFTEGLAGIGAYFGALTEGANPLDALRSATPFMPTALGTDAEGAGKLYEEMMRNRQASEQAALDAKRRDI